jgi:NAD+ synthase (glutamine-hydrolysing)
MKNILRIAIAQMNSTVGDIEGNTKKILEYVNRAKRYKADVVIFPELAVCGYPPEDLLLKPSFIENNLKNTKLIAASVKDIAAIVGFVDKAGQDLYNAAALLADGKIKAIYHKTYLPNYSVFDEKRYFKEGREPFVFRLGDVRCGINICEDIWHPEGPIKFQFKHGAGVIFVINASPYYMGKIKQRERLLCAQAKKGRVFISYVNLVGGQDELVFDGQSFVVDDKGMVIARAEAFKEDLVAVDIETAPKRHDRKTKVALTQKLKPKTDAIPEKKQKILGGLEEVYQALVLGLRDYVCKNGFKKVVVGLSGGIDSSITAVIARDALGASNVIGVFMPSLFTSKESREGVFALVKRLGIKLHTVSINNILGTYTKYLGPVFKGYPKDATEENLQARIRGNILMAISNKFGHLVLTTGNKSEVSCGYCTLYGDMAGGFSVIKDVPKTLVYKLAKFVNRKEDLVPRHVLTRPPTAELRPNQKDTDALPPYDVLDPILKAYVEEDRGVRAIVKKGFKKEIVLKVIRMIDKNEYKRRQASPGVKITPKAFGKDRRMPITNRFDEKNFLS